MVTVALGLALCALAPQQPPAEQLPLRVLYAGNPDSPYSAAWTGFLRAHATSAKFVAGRSLRRSDLADIDLLVVDGEVETHDADGKLALKSEHVPLGLADLQGMPVVLMGGEGGSFADELKLKLSWHAG